MTKRKIHMIEYIPDCPLYEHCTTVLCIHHCKYYNGWYSATNHIECLKDESEEGEE